MRSVMDTTDGCCRSLLIVTRPTHDGLLLLFKIIGSDGGILMLSIGVKRKSYQESGGRTPANRNPHVTHPNADGGGFIYFSVFNAVGAY
jgi:hypothetical protein